MGDTRRGWERFLPGVAVLRRYERRWLRGDLVAGITVAAYLVPQVMAYAAIVGLPPSRGSGRSSSRWRSTPPWVPPVSCPSARRRRRR
nr:SulP family inorganic anion transporter [Tessaracoccus sp. MC1865]